MSIQIIRIFRTSAGSSCDDVDSATSMKLKQILLPPLHGLDGAPSVVGHAVQLAHPPVGALDGLAVPRQLLGDSARRRLRVGHDPPGMVQRGVLRGQRRRGPLGLVEQRRPVRVGGGRPALGGGDGAAAAAAFALLLLLLFVAELVLVGRGSLGPAVACFLVAAGLVVVGKLGHLADVARPLLDLLRLLCGGKIVIGGTIVWSILLLEANLLRRLILRVGISQPGADGPALRPQRVAHVAAPVQPVAQLGRHGLAALARRPRRSGQGPGHQPPLDLHGVEMVGRLSQQHRGHLHVLHVRHEGVCACGGAGIIAIVVFVLITITYYRRAFCGCAGCVMGADLGQRAARLGDEGDEMLLALVKGCGHG